MPAKAARDYFLVVNSSYLVFQRDGKVLLSRRCNTGYHDGDYSLPAGHVEKGEFATAAALREAREEVGVDIEQADLVPAHIMHRRCGDHDRVDFFFTAQRWGGEITNTEPEKCDDLHWFALDALPENVIPYIRAALEHIDNKEFFSEFDETGQYLLKK